MNTLHRANVQPVHGPANYSGVHSALTCEILARQGMQNDHLIQWLMVEFRRSESALPSL